jgi:hypothetical protein
MWSICLYNLKLHFFNNESVADQRTIRATCMERMPLYYLASAAQNFLSCLTVIVFFFFQNLFCFWEEFLLVILEDESFDHKGPF